VLAGGGSLGAVQVGMLKALTRQRVVPDFVVGASVGAINGVYFALEPNEEGVARLERIWLRLRRADVFPVSPVNSILAVLGRRDHLVNPSLLRSLIESELPCQNLEEARIPCYVIATDVLTGAEIALASGSVVAALLASAAIPPSFRWCRLTVATSSMVASPTTRRYPPLSSSARPVWSFYPPACRVRWKRLHVVRSPLPACAQSVSHAPAAQRHRAIRGPSRPDRAAPLCPVANNAYDFSHSDELIHRAEAHTRLWLRKHGLHGAGAPPSCSRTAITSNRIITTIPN